MHVEWSDDMFATGDENIDSQHQYIVKMINLLEEENSKKKRNVQAIRQILIKMKQFLELHFKYEGIFMRKVKFANREALEGEHDHFVSQLTSMIDDLADAEFVDSRVINLLQHGLTNHLKAEREFRRYRKRAEAADQQSKKKGWFW